jgi:hypothetical protein
MCIEGRTQVLENSSTQEAEKSGIDRHVQCAVLPPAKVCS